MATLNTLRTRFGVVLSAVIAFALLAFIFSLRTEMGFSGNDPVVAKIDGHNVTMSEYQTEYNNVMRQSGVSEVDEQQANMLYNATWQSLFQSYALQPGFDSMGLNFGAAERMAVIRGDIPTQTMYSAFADPRTGAYDVNGVNSFLLTSQGNAQAEAMWTLLTDQAREERVTSKYVAMVSAGVNLNALELKGGAEMANKSVNGRWAVKRYSDIADSLVDVSQSEIKSYYEQNKRAYKREATRSISYVSFNVTPSPADKAELQSAAEALGADFAKAKDLRSFIRENRSGVIANNYMTAAQLPQAESKLLVAGKQYGPVNEGTQWKMSRVAESVYASDSLSLRHIVLSYTDRDLVDSLKVALRKGGDFAQAASTYSVYTESAQNGGDLGTLPFSALTDEFATLLAPAKRGDIVEVEVGDMIQLIQVYKAGKRVKQYKTASITTPILASEATRRAAHNAAGLFVVDAKDGLSEFNVAADSAAMAPRTATLTSASRTVPAIDGSTEVARWAHKAEVGDVSEIFKVTDGYVVAVVSAIDNSTHRAMSEFAPTIRRELMKSKKYDMIVAQMSGSTLDAQAASLSVKADDFKDAKFESYYLNGIGVEPRVIGAICSADSKGALAPVMGNSGVYMIEVTDIVEAEEAATEESVKVRLESQMQQQTQQQLFGALESMADVEDMRGATL